MQSSKKALITYLKADKASIEVSNKYANIIDIFSSKLVAKLLVYTEINNYLIELVDDL